MKLFFHYSLGGFSNTYLLGPEGGGDAIIVDPGSMDIAMLNYVEKNDYYVRACLVTHNHENHVRGLSTLKKIYEAEIFSNNSYIDEFPCTLVLDGELRSVCGFDVECMSAPGHSPDSMMFKVGRTVFTGDALSAGLPGRTSSAYGRRLLIRHLRLKLMSQLDDCVILPGHGPPSTVGSERIANRAINSDSLFERQIETLISSKAGS